MSIFDEWRKPNKTCSFYDLTIKENFDFIRVTTDDYKKSFPYLVSLDNQKLFYKADFSGLKDEVQSWLNLRSYYHPPNVAVLMFSDKNDFLQFKIIYGGL